MTPNNQFGFRQKHSTQHAVISLVNNITNSLDRGNIVIALFLDYIKYGIRGIAHKWFTSYLAGRTQYVALDGYTYHIIIHV